MKPIFVFGSNLAGRHGRGAALEAHQKWGAVYGVGEGPTGDSYALPTKDKNIQTMPLEIIKENIERFLSYAEKVPDHLFLVTPVGTGLANYPKQYIADIFHTNDIPSNVVFTKEWFEESWWW